MRLVRAIFIMIASNLFAAEPFAVVELFTSEGCSSCPPADTLLNELARQPQVFALAFHVDYWNYLGWADPFSQAQFTDRQRAYGRETYTPQMIVNGTEVFVGSDRTKAKRAIEAALKRPTVVELKLRWDNQAIAYEVTGAPKDVVLHLALLESGITQKVSRGENAGRTLRHDNVVRVFETVRLDQRLTGAISLKLPANLKGENVSVIGFVQAAGSSTILGTATIP